MPTNDDKDFSELLEDYMVQNHVYHMEGESGVRNLQKIANAIGYRDLYSDSLVAMLADNPGMQQAMIEWLMQQNVLEWKDALMNEMPKNKDGDDD